MIPNRGETVTSSVPAAAHLGYLARSGSNGHGQIGFIQNTTASVDSVCVREATVDELGRDTRLPWPGLDADSEKLIGASKISGVCRESRAFSASNCENSHSETSEIFRCTHNRNNVDAEFTLFVNP